MIEVNNATKIYRMGSEEIRALDSVDLSVPEGEFISLVGPSGSGKSTLMNVIGALDTIDEGTITIGSVEISGMRDKEQAAYRRNTVGFVFQTFNLMPRLTALENVELPLILDAIPRAEREERAMNAIARVGLSDRASHRPPELSGGQQQRVAIARAIVHNPDILLADEPTGNLDTNTGNEIIELIGNLNKDDGVTIIMVTHNKEYSAYADRVLSLRDGKIVNSTLKS